MQVKKQQLESVMEQWTGSKFEKENGYTLFPRLFNFYAEYIKIARININNLR